MLLELITDLSTSCFKAALRQFVARRGKPSRILYDNGTNFVVCHNELKSLIQFPNSKSDIMISCVVDVINWSFMPAHSPHFCGIRQAGVKSMKVNLKPVLSEVKLTYEDFSSILTQVEEVLNSPPLSQLSSDPSDLYPFTPAHFLIRRSMDAIPDIDLSNIKTRCLSRFDLQSILQHSLNLN